MITTLVRKAIANGFVHKSFQGFDLISDCSSFLEDLASKGKVDFLLIEGTIRGGRSQHLSATCRETEFDFWQEGDITENWQTPYIFYKADVETGIIYKIVANWEK